MHIVGAKRMKFVEIEPTLINGIKTDYSQWDTNLFIVHQSNLA